MTGNSLEVMNPLGLPVKQTKPVSLFTPESARGVPDKGV